MTLRVLHIGKYWPPYKGGIETFMADLLVAQVWRGDRVGVLVHDHSKGRLPAAGVERGVEVWRVPAYGRLLYAPIAPTFFLHLERVLSSFRPQLLHLHMPNTSVFWALMSSAARAIPWVVHWHSDVISSEHDLRLALLYPLYRPFERAVLARSGAIIATSPPYRDSSTVLREWADRVHVVPLGIDPERIAGGGDVLRDWARGHWSGNRLRLLSIGRFTYYKGHETLLRAVARVEGVELILVGEGERRPGLETLLRSLGIEGRVQLTGKLSDEAMHALLAECDLFCLPSLERTEAFGVVLMEAMAHGRPALVSAIPGSGVGWVVGDGVEGLHAPPGDVDGWEVALRRLTEDCSSLEGLGRSAYRRYRENFRIDRVAERTAEVYSSVLSGAEK